MLQWTECTINREHQVPNSKQVQTVEYCDHGKRPLDKKSLDQEATPELCLENGRKESSGLAERHVVMLPGVTSDEVETQENQELEFVWEEVMQQEVDGRGTVRTP